MKLETIVTGTQNQCYSCRTKTLWRVYIYKPAGILDYVCSTTKAVRAAVPVSAPAGRKTKPAAPASFVMDVDEPVIASQFQRNDGSVPSAHFQSSPDSLTSDQLVCISSSILTLPPACDNWIITGFGTVPVWLVNLWLQYRQFISKTGNDSIFAACIPISLVTSSQHTCVLWLYLWCQCTLYLITM